MLAAAVNAATGDGSWAATDGHDRPARISDAAIGQQTRLPDRQPR
jgi:hypothetical protein